MYLLVWLDMGTGSSLFKRCKTIEEMLNAAELLEASGNQIVAYTKILSAIDIHNLGGETPAPKLEQL